MFKANVASGLAKETGERAWEAGVVNAEQAATIKERITKLSLAILIMLNYIRKGKKW